MFDSFDDLLRFLTTSRGVGGEEPQNGGKAAVLSSSSASHPPSPSADDPVTSKQLALMKKLKIKIPVDVNRASASALIKSKLEEEKS